MDRIRASLVYDTRAQPLSSGMRAVIQRARHLLYTADETEIMLHIGPDRKTGHLRLTGQVLDAGMPVEGAAVELQRPTGCLNDSTDEEGEFQIGSLEPGTYRLTIERPVRSIDVPPFEVE